MSNKSYESIVVANLDEAQRKSVIESALATIQESNPRVHIEHKDQSLVVLRYGLNWESYGERVRITAEPGAFRVVSECIFPLQLIDWGKNRKNVEMIRECILTGLQDINQEQRHNMSLQRTGSTGR